MDNPPPNEPPLLSPPPSPSEPPKPSGWQRFAKALGPVGVVLVLIVNWFAKLKFLFVPIIKFGPVVLKSGGTMLLSIGAYTLVWGWKYAVGFVLLIFVHEAGHWIIARQFGLKAGAPVFIPFMGAYVALKDLPPNAWVEACVAIGGPLLGSLGAALCAGVFRLTDEPLYSALAYSGFMLNLFNLMPIGFLDGGRIAPALSPWLWIVGLLGLLGVVIAHPNIILIIVLVTALPRVFMLFRAKTDEERRYFEVTGPQRLTMAILYFGLIAVLVAGMTLTHIAPDRL